MENKDLLLVYFWQNEPTAKSFACLGVGEVVFTCRVRLAEYQYTQPCLWLIFYAGNTLDEVAASWTWPSQIPPGCELVWDAAPTEERREQRYGASPWCCIVSSTSFYFSTAYEL